MTPLIATIYGRCTIEGECWNWQGAGITPTMRVNQRTSSVRQFIFKDQGIDTGGKVATYRCGNSLCVNPDHMHLITRKALQKRTVKTTRYTSTVLRRSKIAEQARARSKLSLKQVEAIRQAEGTQRAIAASFGVSQSAVQDIRAGNTWRTYSGPFAGLMSGRAA